MENLKKSYDLIIVDAFNGDAVPTHLLTKEALELYDEQLTDDGFLILHLTNRYVDLKQVFANTLDFAAHDCYYQFDNRAGSKYFKSEWMLAVKKGFKASDLRGFGWVRVNPKKSNSELAWSDSQSSVFRYLLYQNIF